MEFVKNILNFYNTLVTSVSTEFGFFILFFVGVMVVLVVSKIFSLRILHTIKNSLRLICHGMMILRSSENEKTGTYKYS